MEPLRTKKAVCAPRVVSETNPAFDPDTNQRSPLSSAVLMLFTLPRFASTLYLISRSAMTSAEPCVGSLRISVSPRATTSFVESL